MNLEQILKLNNTTVTVEELLEIERSKAVDYIDYIEDETSNSTTSTVCYTITFKDDSIINGHKEINVRKINKVRHYVYVYGDTAYTSDVEEFDWNKADNCNKFFGDGHIENYLDTEEEAEEYIKNTLTEYEYKRRE